VKLSQQVKDVLTADIKLSELNRKELLALAEDDSCPQFLMQAIATEFLQRLNN
jgi:hypothetical protein